MSPLTQGLNYRSACDIHRRRDAAVELSRVGVGGVHCALVYYFAFLRLVSLSGEIKEMAAVQVCVCVTRLDHMVHCATRLHVNVHVVLGLADCTVTVVIPDTGDCSASLPATQDVYVSIRLTTTCMSCYLKPSHTIYDRKCPSKTDCG